jgi:hypothetical protein
MVESALSVPPWSLRLQDMLGHVWESVLNCERSRREDFLEQLQPDLGHVPYTAAELATLVNEFEDATAAADTEKPRISSWRSIEFSVLVRASTRRTTSSSFVQASLPQVLRFTVLGCPA